MLSMYSRPALVMQYKHSCNQHTITDLGTVCSLGNMSLLCNSSNHLHECIYARMKTTGVVIQQKQRIYGALSHPCSPPLPPQYTPAHLKICEVLDPYLRSVHLLYGALSHNAPPPPPPPCPAASPAHSKVHDILDMYLKSVHLPADIQVTVLCRLLLLHTDKAISNACQARGKSPWASGRVEKEGALRRGGAGGTGEGKHKSKHYQYFCM